MHKLCRDAIYVKNDLTTAGNSGIINSGGVKTMNINNSDGENILRLPDFEIGRSVGAKARNYDVVGPDGTIYNFVEGTKIQNAAVFAGKGTKFPLHDGVPEGLSKEHGGNPENWQHAKGFGVLNDGGEEREAEVHWFQETTAGKVKFKVKEWLDES